MYLIWICGSAVVGMIMCMVACMKTSIKNRNKPAEEYKHVTQTPFTSSPSPSPSQFTSVCQGSSSTSDFTTSFSSPSLSPSSTSSDHKSYSFSHTSCKHSVKPSPVRDLNEIGAIDRDDEGNPFIPNFSGPLRFFFGLHFADGEQLWKSAIHLATLGGNGECEKMAIVGDSILKQTVLEILRKQDPSASPRRLHMRCQLYITNKALSKLSRWMHLNQHLPIELSRLGLLNQTDKMRFARKPKKRHIASCFPNGNPSLNLSEHQQSTVYEALLYATKTLYGGRITTRVVEKMMRLIQGEVMSDFVACGFPIMSRSNQIIGMTSCVTAGGVSFFTKNIIESLQTM